MELRHKISFEKDEVLFIGAMIHEVLNKCFNYLSYFRVNKLELEFTVVLEFFMDKNARFMKYKDIKITLTRSQVIALEKVLRDFPIAFWNDQADINRNAILDKLNRINICEPST